MDLGMVNAKGISRKPHKTNTARLAWALITPTALIVFGLVIFPAVFNIWVSFHNVGLHNLNDVFHAPFVGVQNYQRVFKDFSFEFQGWDNWGAAVTTVVYAFSATTLSTTLGLIAALLLNQPFKGKGVARAIFLFPYVAPMVSIAFVWRWILDPRPSGVLNDLLLRLNIIDTSHAFLSTRGLSLIVVILLDAWRYFPFAMLMILSRLQAVDDTLYEAATVDGANSVQKFFFITLPELRYVIGAIFLLRLMWTFNKFDDIFLYTGGGFGTKVLSILTYEFSFRLYDFGRGAATSVIQLLILVVFLVVYISLVMKSVGKE
jgi:multiple sugar transport system permease protein